jgi:drug/metabolite transporter (DMT)-like permease
MLLSAVIWGFAFVAQREGSEHVGAFIFNGTRFLLGSIWLVPFLIFSNKKSSDLNPRKKDYGIIPGLILGVVMFVAVSFQQIGITYTTAGKAGFITGMYVVFVPLFGFFLKKNITVMNGISAIIAFCGLYFLSIDEAFSLTRGDALVLISAIFWAMHVLFADYYVDRWDALKLAFIQFFFCALLSLLFGFILEEIQLNQLRNALLPIIYAGLLSVGVGFTLQLIGQKEAHPAHASIILSLEGLFAVLGGWLLLKEILSMREIFGCILMLSGMILSQLQFHKFFNPKISDN